MKLAVSEVFYSLQGEGSTTGIPSVFVRLAGCNLMCGGQGTQFDKELHNGATWRCDTIEVWMEGIAKEFDEILNEECRHALALGAHLVLTGGEPLLQSDALENFIKYVEHNLGAIFVECETNGTLPPIKGVDLWNCSPKMENSGNSKESRYRPEILHKLNELNTQFKFVVSELLDTDEIIMDFLPFIANEKIVIMPAGENQEQLKRTRPIAAEICKQYGWRFTDRMHISIWDRKTGV